MKTWFEESGRDFAAAIPDRLGKSRWYNAPISNLTQTRYARFVRRPWGESRSAFKDAADKFESRILG